MEKRYKNKKEMDADIRRENRGSKSKALKKKVTRDSQGVSSDYGKKHPYAASHPYAKGKKLKPKGAPAPYKY